MECKKCHAIVDNSAKFCSECGCKLDLAVPPPPPPPPLSACSGCGIPVLQGSRFCTKCGTPLNVQADNQQQSVGDMDLTPAESLAIYDKNPALKFVVNFTLMDLILRNIIKVRTVTSGNKDPKDTDSILFNRGDNWKTCVYRPHEKLFTDFLETDRKEVALSEVVEKVKLETDMVEARLIRPLCVKGFYVIENKKALGFIKYKKYTHTPKGESARRVIAQWIEDGKSKLAGWVQSEPSRAAAFMAMAGGNLFMLGVAGIEISEISNWVDQLKLMDTPYDIGGYYNCFWGPVSDDIADIAATDLDFEFSKLNTYDFGQLGICGDLDSDFADSGFDGGFDSGYDDGGFDGGD